jgi:LEA14-like dessication related protein
MTCNGRLNIPVTWLALLVLAISGCASLHRQIEEPSLSIVGLEIVDLGLLQQRYAVTLNVQNPNPLTLPVSGMSYALQVGGKDFARGVTSKPFTLPAYGEAQVQVDLTTNLLDSVRRIQALLDSGMETVGYSLTGRLQVDLPFVGAVPFQNRGEINLAAITR